MIARADGASTERPRRLNAVQPTAASLSSAGTPMPDATSIALPPTSAVAPAMILFLDFDGVLHEDPCFDEARLFARAPELVQALAPFPEVRIVLSTSWRSQSTLAEMTQPLPDGLRQRVIDTTPLATSADTPAALRPYRRHAECATWLRSQGHEQTPWVALDDRPSLFAPHCEQLILCDSNVGFVDASARRLQAALLRGRFRRLQPIGAAS
jgi:hypothetical protein